MSASSGDWRRGEWAVSCGECACVRGISQISPRCFINFLTSCFICKREVFIFVSVVVVVGGGAAPMALTQPPPRGRVHARGCPVRGSHASSGGETGASARTSSQPIGHAARPMEERKKKGESL